MTERYKLIDGIRIAMSEAEKSAKEAEENTWRNANPVKSDFDLELIKIREKRNKLLADTDYIVTMNLEAGNTVPAEWVTYRQSLRDLTNGLTTVEQVNAVVYPTKPE